MKRSRLHWLDQAALLVALGYLGVWIGGWRGLGIVGLGYVVGYAARRVADTDFE